MRRSRLVLGAVIACISAVLSIGVTFGGPGVFWAATGPAFQGPCDLLSDHCAAAHSMAQSYLSTYSGPLFELVKVKPIWTGTGYIATTTFTVSSTTTGALAAPSAPFATVLSAVASSTAPALTPLTYLTGGGGSSWTVNNSQTAGSSGSPLTMIAYSVYDVLQAAHVADVSGIPAFCANDQCLVLKIFNETSTGAANDVIASNVSANDGGSHGPGGAPDCTATIITCAPIFMIDAAVNVGMAVTNWPGEMENSAGSTTPTSGLPGVGASKSVLMSVRSEFASNCCAQYGPKEPIGSIPVGSMFQPFNAWSTNTGTGATICLSANTFCSGIDGEWGTATVANYTGFPGRWTFEAKYDSGTNKVFSYAVDPSATVTTLFNETAPFTVATGNHYDMGSAGDRTVASTYFYGGYETVDVTDHTAVYNNIKAFFAGRSTANPHRGPLDLAFFTNGNGNSSGIGIVGNSLIGYSMRQLSASYTGYLVDLTNSGGPPTTNSYGAINGVLDPAAATFCAATPPCFVSKWYFQGPAGTNTTSGTLHDPLTDLTASGAARPTITFSSLNGLATVHFSGAQKLCSGTWGTSGAFNGFAGPYLSSVVARRTTVASYAAAFTSPNATGFIGFNNTSGNARINLDTPGSGSFMAVAASENHWHSIIGNMISSNSSAIIDGVTLATDVTHPTDTYSVNVCLGDDPTASYPLTGDIAEAILISTQNAVGTPLNLIATVFALQEAAWGTLPN